MNKPVVQRVESDLLSLTRFFLETEKARIRHYQLKVTP